MPINQEQFLGHPNANGNTRAMSDIQKEQQQFWRDVYLAAAQKGSATYAEARADEALKLFNERFIPINTVPQDKPPSWLDVD